MGFTAPPVKSCLKPIKTSSAPNVIAFWSIRCRGGKYHRSFRIKPEDWTPFTRLLAAYDTVEDGIFVSFQFVDRRDEKDDFGRGPTMFQFNASVTIRMDICISVPDWLAGKLDINAVITALQKLPYLSFCAGYGLCMSEQAVNGVFPESHGVVQKYPALDVAHPGLIAHYSEDPIQEVGICGINWLTGIGEPFRTQAGGVWVHCALFGPPT